MLERNSHGTRERNYFGRKKPGMASVFGAPPALAFRLEWIEHHPCR